MEEGKEGKRERGREAPYWQDPARDTFLECDRNGFLAHVQV